MTASTILQSHYLCLMQRGECGVLTWRDVDSSCVTSLTVAGDWEGGSIPGLPLLLPQLHRQATQLTLSLTTSVHRRCHPNTPLHCRLTIKSVTLKKAAARLFSLTKTCGQTTFPARQLDPSPAVWESQINCFACLTGTFR